jgi:hypothetical protein
MKTWNAPLDRNTARRIRLATLSGHWSGGAWSSARAVIRDGGVEGKQCKECRRPSGARMRMEGWEEGSAEAVIIREPASRTREPAAAEDLFSPESNCSMVHRPMVLIS